MEAIDMIKEINKLDILIVEDGDDIREIMSTTFGKICHSARTAVDGEDGLKKFNESKPDLIISDIRMPNMNGNDMIDAIKKDNPSLPIIVVTGHGKIIKATENADIILEKPIKFDKLLENMYQLTR